MQYEIDVSSEFDMVIRRSHVLRLGNTMYLGSYYLAML